MLQTQTSNLSTITDRDRSKEKRSSILLVLIKQDRKIIKERFDSPRSSRDLELASRTLSTVAIATIAARMRGQVTQSANS